MKKYQSVITFFAMAPKTLLIQAFIVD